MPSLPKPERERAEKNKKLKPQTEETNETEEPKKKGYAYYFGRPHKVKTLEDFDNYILEYLEECEKNDNPPTLSGLQVVMNISDTTWNSYEHRTDFDFLTSIKNFKKVCEGFVESGMLKGDVPTAAGIFNLCNNYKERWKNTQYIDQRSENTNYNKDLTDAKDSELEAELNELSGKANPTNTDTQGTEEKKG